MAIDAFVLPLPKYLRGDFTTPLESLFGPDKVKRISIWGGIVEKFRSRHVRRTTATVESFLASHGITYSFATEGNVEISQQYHNHNKLFEYLHTQENGRERFKSLVELNVYSGMVIPCNFPEPLDSKHLELPVTSIHSADQIASAISEVDKLLQVPPDWNFKDGPPELFHARSSLYQLRQFISAVTSSNLPLIFWG
ncbi:hypothetical protein [Verrucomicrobium sp. BvORR106]|uniref:hypothetical protein n=1 Tax=Verrucomicrobium sp. BvORR106 TaxID=1403819 RepID=UPI00057176A3|nr:hypothetical protein [Verrucomicrobium sp. BvORR106]